MCPLYKEERLRVTPGFCANRYEMAKTNPRSESKCGGCTCGEWASLHGYFPAEAEAANAEPPRRAVQARQMCRVEGCEKHPIAGCDGMCRSHWKEVQQGTRKLPVRRPKPKGRAKVQPGVLSLVKGAPEMSGRPGIFLDFTGHEDVLERLHEVSEDVNHDVVCILSAVLDGKMAFLGGR